MNKTTIIIYVLLCMVSLQTNAQDKYWIFLTDKNNVEFNPLEYFDNKAINRRIKNNIPLKDSTDFPLRKDYLLIISKNTEKINAKSRWFNAVSVIANKKQIDILKTFSFVKKIEQYVYTKSLSSYLFDSLITENEKKLIKTQVDRMEGNLFFKKGITGKGIRIAVFDAGFPSVDKNPVFKHLIENNKIIKTWDFVRKKENVFAYNPHGTMVLSCIAGKLNNHRFGLALDAEFLLARTEVVTEKFSEEENWLEAAEWADKNGADIINSSLAYTYHRYHTFEMDGTTSLVSKAANMASKKGILVINAMGNDGNKDWKILATPADVENVLSVGAINPNTNYHAAYSSFGPTSRYKMKPNVVSVGKVIAASKNKFKKVRGTSFAAPLIAGFAACALQNDTSLTNMQLFKKIQEAADLYPYYDYAHGYGVPQASKILTPIKSASANKTFEFEKKGNEINIIINKEYIKTKGFNNSNYLYYHIENSDGILEQYFLIDVYQKKAATINLKEYDLDIIIRAHYKGYTLEYKVN